MRKAAQVLLLAFVLAGPALSQEDDNFDVSLFRQINNQQNPERDGFFEYLDNTSIPTFAIVPGGFFLIGAFRGDKAVADAGVLSLFSQGAALGLTTGLKLAVDRPRPFQSLDDVNVKHLSTASGASFPSGHTSQAFAIATILSLNYSKPLVTIPLYVWAGLIAYGRIYLGVHYPTDVLGGMLVGFGSSLAVWSLRFRIREITKGIFPDENRTVPVYSVRGSVPRIEFVRLALPLN